MKVEAYGAICVGNLDEALNQSVGHWLRFSGAHQHAVDPQRPVDATPAILGQIKNREKVLRKQGRADCLHHSGMPAIFQVSWKKYPKLLILKLLGGLQFTLRLRAYDVPPFPGRKRQPA